VFFCGEKKGIMNCLGIIVLFCQLFGGPQAACSVGYGEFYERGAIYAAAMRNGCTQDDYVLLLAVRKAENGRQGCEFGVKHPDAWETNLDTQAGWAAATVVKNRLRFNLTTENTESTEEFINYLADRYCPGSVDRRGNENFKRNVKIVARDLGLGAHK